MATAKSGRIVQIVFAVLVLGALTQNSCLQANWARLRIRQGMTASEALRVSGDWTWGHAASEDPPLNPAIDLPFSHMLIFHGQKDRQQFASLDEVAQSLQQRMMGHAWHMTLSFLGTGRPLFTVFFDKQGKVQAVSKVCLGQG
jgi:hypothetical protein